jgi:hypothetical protein
MAKYGFAEAPGNLFSIRVCLADLISYLLAVGVLTSREELKS